MKYLVSLKPQWLAISALLRGSAQNATILSWGVTWGVPPKLVSVLVFRIVAYVGSSSLEINSLRLCSLVAKLHGWDRERSYRVPGKYSTEHNVVIFRLYEAETIERAVSS